MQQQMEVVVYYHCSSSHHNIYCIEESWPNLERKTSRRQQPSLKPPTCATNILKNGEHLTQDQTTINTLRITPCPSSSPLDAYSDASPDAATPASTNSPTATANDKDNPSPNLKNHDSSLLDSFLLHNTPFQCPTLFWKGSPT